MASYTRISTFDIAKAGHPEGYYSERFTFLDLRGKVKISPLSYWGYGNRIISASHGLSRGEFQPCVVLKDIVVDDYAWVTSFCTLYNVHLCHHAIVSIGSVVVDMTVPPYTVVAGNPARPTYHWNGKLWERLDCEHDRQEERPDYEHFYRETGQTPARPQGDEG